MLLKEEGVVAGDMGVVLSQWWLAEEGKEEGIETPVHRT